MPRFPQSERETIHAATRQKLMDAAIQQFAEKGYAETNINAISTAAGFAKGTIYNYFASKQALMLALIDEVGRAHYEAIASQVTQEADPAARLERFFRAGFDFIAQHPAPARFMLTTLYSPAAELKQRLAAAYLPMFRLLAEEILQPGVDQGLFQPMQAMATASLLMTLYLGSGSSVDETGKPYMDPLQVATFALNALRYKEA